MKNKSRHFLPQLVGLNQFEVGFLGCYIGDINEDLDFNHIYILMEEECGFLDIHPDTLKRRKVPEGYLYKLKIDDKYGRDLEKFYEGKYSEISEDGKQIMISYSGLLPEESLCYNVLYKTKKRKEFIENVIGMELPEGMEYMSILNLSEEIYED